MKENLSYQHTEDGEVHPGEVVRRRSRCPERFGLWISFYPFSQDEYLAIVAQWLRTWRAEDAIAAARQEPSLVGAGAWFALGRVRVPVCARLAGRTSRRCAPQSPAVAC